MEMTNGPAPSANWVVRSWQTEEGLPQNTVNAILQTRDGFLWVGTSGGLARFDGARFRKFGLQDGLRSVQIFRLAEDRDGTLWVGTVGGGLSRWENDGRFSTFGPAEGFTVGTVQALQPDRDGSLWIGGERGLVKWSHGTFKSIGTGEGLPNGQIRALAQDTNGSLWVSVLSQGLFRETNGQFVPEGTSSVPRNVYSLMADRDGSIWTGTQAAIWQGREGSWMRFGRTNGLSNDTPEWLAQGRDGTLWLTAQNSGLFRFSEGRFQRVTTESGLSAEKTITVTVDRDDSIWVGTAAGGLYRMSRRVLQYWGTTAGLGKSGVTSVTEDADGLLWVMTRDLGVHQLRAGRFSRFREPTNSSSYPNIYTSTRTSDGSVWAAGEQALFRFRARQPAQLFLEPPLRGEAIRALCADGDALWLGTYYSTLLKWETNSLRIMATNGSFGSGINSLACEGKDTLWVGSASGLYKWERGTVREWTTRGALLSSNIRALHRDPDGTLWIGTLGGGLGRLQNGRMFNITTRHGLIDDVISQIVPDDFGHLWLGCNRGIMRLNRQEIDALAEGKTSELQPVVFGKNEGMLKEQCTGGHSPTALKTKDGRLLFPTMGGLAEIDPRRLEEFTSSTPRASIDGILLDGQPQALNAPLVVPPGYHHLEISYTAPSLPGGEWLRFRYRLEGLDDKWETAGTRRRATYEGLPPGHYTFRAAASGGRGAWEEPGASLAFTVQPFVWQTIWFRFGAVLLLVGGSAGAVGRMASVRRRRERREFERAQEQSSALLALSEHPAVAAGDLPAAFREICERAARTLGVSRVGIWLLDEKAGQLHAANVFDAATQSHVSGQVLSLSGAPRYLQVLQKERVIVVRDVQHDTQTNELSEQHFLRSGVGAVLDAQVRVSEKLAALIRHEQIDAPRDWKQDEITFAGEIADQVARTLLNAERENANRQVRESETRFRTVANAAPVMIWMAGTDKLCNFFNKGWLRFTGRTLEQEMGHGWTQGVHPDDLAACVKTYEESFEVRREFTMEYRLRKQNGDYAWILDTGTPRFMADGTFAGYVGSATDITALKQAQERWRSVVEGASTAMLVADADGKITLVNARTEAVFGYTRAELLGQPVEMLVPETFRAQHPAQRQHYMANHAVRTMGAGRELFGRRKDGSTVPLEVGLNLIRTPEGQFVLASVIDITERLAAEANLRESEKRMTMVAEAAHLGMWVWDAPETYIWTSAKWKAIHGYAPDENIRFDALVERIHPEDRDMVGRTVTDAFNDRSTFHVQHRLLLPDGTVRWISMSGRVEPVKNGPLRLMGISIDISERKEVEEAAREVSGKLITAQEDERRRIARDLHDDLNQRLAMLSVQTDLLGRMDNAPRAQEIISDIASHVQDLSTEVHKLSYQLHPAKLDQLGLVAAARSFCHELGRQYGVSVEFAHEDIPRDLNGTAALCLYRIIQEALQNVVKHSGASRARVDLRRREGAIALAIADNGRGFDRSAIGHQAGLGLVGMRERVRLMHGEIAFHSALNRGTRIEVTIPLTVEDAVT